MEKKKRLSMRERQALKREEEKKSDNFFSKTEALMSRASKESKLTELSKKQKFGKEDERLLEIAEAKAKIRMSEYQLGMQHAKENYFNKHGLKINGEVPDRVDTEEVAKMIKNLRIKHSIDTDDIIPYSELTEKEKETRDLINAVVSRVDGIDNFKDEECIDKASLENYDKIVYINKNGDKCIRKYTEEEKEEYKRKIFKKEFEERDKEKSNKSNTEEVEESSEDIIRKLMDE